MDEGIDPGAEVDKPVPEELWPDGDEGVGPADEVDVPDPVEELPGGGWERDPSRSEAESDPGFPPPYGQRFPVGGMTQGNRLASCTVTKSDWILESVTVEGSMMKGWLFGVGSVGLHPGPRVALKEVLPKSVFP